MRFIRTGFLHLLSLVVCASFLFGAALSVQAAETVCGCYCKVDGVGAKKIGDVTAQACQDACKAQKKLVAACATDSAQLPDQNITCFDASECTAQNGTLDTKYQPGECMEGERYCYADPSKAIKAKLQVSIGSLTVPEDLGEYVAAAYKWMIGASTLIAIVLIMVGGLQWTMAAVSAEQIAKAKKRIVNGVVGLVLLLSTYLILATVNPNLLKLQVPQLPMIKTVALVDGETSCGYLTGLWGESATYLTKNGAPTDSPHATDQPPPKGGKPYTLEKPSKGVECGSVATITKDWEGNSVTPEGTTCTYDYCEDKGEKCFVSAAGGQCVGCKEIVSGNSYFTPSTSICSALSLPTTFLGDGTHNQQIQQCFWTNAAIFLDRADLTADYSTWDDGTCAMLTIDCSQITTCWDYKTKAKVENTVGTLELGSVPFSGTVNTVFGDILMGDESLASVCNDDPCLVSARKEMENMECVSPVFAGDNSTLTTLLTFLLSNNCVPRTK